MSIGDFERGKTAIMTAARAELRRTGMVEHSVMFDVHTSEPLPTGATLTLGAAARTVSAWFSAREILAALHGPPRGSLAAKIAAAASDLREGAHSPAVVNSTTGGW